MRTFESQLTDSELAEIFTHYLRQKQAKKQKLLKTSASEKTGLGNSFKSSSNGKGGRNLKGINKDLQESSDKDSEIAKIDQLMDLVDLNLPFD